MRVPFLSLAGMAVAAALGYNTLTYTAQAPDTSPPWVAVTAPALDAQVYGTAMISASASDDVGVAGVQFVLDGTPLGPEDTAAPFAMSWDTMPAAVGSHLLSARARDAAGNMGDSELLPFVVIRPDTTPPVIGVSPPSGTVFAPSIVVTMTANEPATLFYTTDGTAPTVDSNRGTSPLVLSPFSNTTTVRFFARDNFGNLSSAASATYVRNSDATAPVAVAPLESFSSGALPSSGLPLTLTWSATDIGTGVGRYELQRSTDGGSTWRSESLSSSLRTSKQVTLTSGSSYRYRVRAIDVAGNIGSYATAPTFRPFIYEDGLANVAPASPVLAYAGPWTVEANSAATAGTRRFASAAGANAVFTFTGRSIAWVAERGPGKGQAEVWIDGVRVSTVDLYNSSTRPRYVAYRRTFDAAGSHTLQIRVRGTKKSDATGTRIDVDAFLVTR